MIERFIRHMPTAWYGGEALIDNFFNGVILEIAGMGKYYQFSNQSNCQQLNTQDDEEQSKKQGGSVCQWYSHIGSLKNQEKGIDNSDHKCKQST